MTKKIWLSALAISAVAVGYLAGCAADEGTRSDDVDSQSARVGSGDSGTSDPNDGPGDGDDATKPPPKKGNGNPPPGAVPGPPPKPADAGAPGKCLDGVLEEKTCQTEASFRNTVGTRCDARSYDIVSFGVSQDGCAKGSGKTAKFLCCE